MIEKCLSPPRAGSIVEHIQPGHVIRILTDRKGDLVRVYNKTTDLIYEQKDTALTTMTANMGAFF